MHKDIIHALISEFSVELYASLLPGAVIIPAEQVKLLIEKTRKYYYTDGFRRTPTPSRLPDTITTVIGLEALYKDKFGLLNIRRIASRYRWATTKTKLNDIRRRNKALFDLFCNDISKDAGTSRRLLHDDRKLGEAYGIFWASHRNRRAIAVETAWVTTYRRPAATHLRDRLGLVHHSKDAALFEMSLRRPKTGIAGPTFLESQAHSRFKAKPDGRCKAGWGVAVDLASAGKGAAVNWDGAAEVVVRPLPTTDIVGCRYLDVVDEDPIGSDADFAREFLRKRRLRRTALALAVARI